MNPVSVSPMAVVGLPFLEQIDILSSQNVEFFGVTILGCAEYGWDNSRRALERFRGRIAYICHGPAVDADDDEGWAEQLKLLTQAVDLAADLDIPWLYFTTGRQGKLLWEQAAQRWSTRMRPIVDYARALYVGITVENTMAIRSDISFTHSVKDTATLAQMVGAYLCVDLYCCWGEAGLSSILQENLERISLVQVSDMCIGDLGLPNRRVLGEGELPTEELIRLVQSIGYEGVLDIELIGPQVDAYGPAVALKRSVAWLRGLLQ